jgi:hypothetical protein
VTAVIIVPPSLDDKGFEHVLEQLASQPDDAKIIVDARHCTFGTPYGLTAMLTLGQTRAEKATFLPPIDGNVSTYWSRAGFFRYAEELFDIQGSVPRVRSTDEGDKLLGITPIAAAADVHLVVERIAEQARHILTTRLKLEPRAQMGFTMALSETVQNIVDHAGHAGWVMAQAYQYRQRLAGRWVAEIVVCDPGMGFRRSLEMGNRRPITDRWGDGLALETALIQGVSRFPDAGRGQGLKGTRGYIGRRNGMLTIRSGTARIGLIPTWDDSVPLQENLPYFPGAQLRVIIPGELAGGTP